MSFTVLIPARLSSTRLPRKPLADICGLPMVVRVARRAAQSRAAEVVVAAADVALWPASALPPPGASLGARGSIPRYTKKFLTRRMTKPCARLG